MILRCDCGDSPRFENKELVTGVNHRRLTCTCYKCTIWFTTNNPDINTVIAQSWNDSYGTVRKYEAD